MPTSPALQPTSAAHPVRPADPPSAARTLPLHDPERPMGPAPAAAPTHPTRLESLLQAGPGTPRLDVRASREAVAEARGLGTGTAAAILSGVLDRHVAWSMDRAAERAADVAGQLRLAGTIPALIRCLDRLSDLDPAAHAALRALAQMRAEATGPLLDSYRRCPTLEDRCLRATVLARTCVRDGRVRAALTELLAENVRAAAGALAEHGDRDAVPALGAALDRLEPLAPGTPGELERLEEIVAVAQAIKLLRGKRSKAQEAKFRSAYARSDEIWANGGPEDAPPDGP